MAEATVSLDSLLNTVAAAAQSQGIEAYLVGGFVRDRILGKVGKDIDMVAVGSDGIPLLAEVARQLRWAPPVVFERFGTGQIRGGDWILEIVRARAESYEPESRNPAVRPGTLEEDILRRDFTVNALSQRFDGELLDITGQGLDDLRDGILRTPLDPNVTFSDDPLRMFRAARFVAQLGFRLADGVLAAMQAEVERSRILSVERITEELRRLLISPFPRQGLEVLRDSGLIDVVIPELRAMVGVEQGGYHIYDVFDHSCHAVAAANPDPLTRLAALLHDVGKPATHVLRDDGKHTFTDHPVVGAKIARDLLGRLRFSNEETDATCRLIELHMRPILYDEATFSDAAVRRLIRDAGQLRTQMLDLARADTMASSYPDTTSIDSLERRMTQLDADGKLSSLRPPLSGDELMSIYDRPPGRWLGMTQKALLEAVMDGEIDPQDGDGARIWLRANPGAVPD